MFKSLVFKSLVVFVDYRREHITQLARIFEHSKLFQVDPGPTVFADRNTNRKPGAETNFNTVKGFADPRDVSLKFVELIIDLKYFAAFGIDDIGKLIEGREEVVTTTSQITGDITVFEIFVEDNCALVLWNTGRKGCSLQRMSQFQRTGQQAQ